MKDEIPLYAEGTVKEISPTESSLPEKRERTVLITSHHSSSVIGRGLALALAATAIPVDRNFVPRRGGYDGYEIQPVPDYQSKMTPRNQRRMQKKALKKPRR